MKKLFILFLLATIGTKAQTPTFQWAKSLLSTSKLSVSYGKSIVADAAGNTYITGGFEGTVDFDPGPGVYNLSVLPPLHNIYILKLDAAGNFLWVKDIVGASLATGNSIALDAIGNIYSTGFFKGTADFDPGSGIATLVADSNHSAYVLKLDPTGNFVWVKNVGGSIFSSSADAVSLDLDVSGNIYTTGYFYGTVDFDPGAGINNLTATGGFNSFVSKLDSSGNFLWASAFGGTSAVTASSIAVDAAGNVLTTGYFSQTADFDPGVGVFNLISTPMSISLYISKLDPFGNFIWAKTMGGTSSTDASETFSILVDAANNIYTSGYYTGTVDFDPSTSTASLTALYDNMFISKLDPSGNFLWVKTIDGASTGSSRGHSLVLGAGGSLYATGQFSGICDFDPGVGVVNQTASGSDDAFVLKLDPAGNFVWATRAGGSGFANARGLSLTLSGSSVFSIGRFQGTVDFDFGSGVFTMPSLGTLAMYVQKISQAETSVGTTNLTSDNTFSIYPNPTSTTLNIISNGAKQSQIRIVNAIGETIYTAYTTTEKTTIDFSRFRSGIYFIQINSTEGTIVKKIVKE